MDSRIAYVVKVIERYYGNGLRLSQLATAVGLSRSRFEHLFKQEIGQDYRAYLVRTRMARAKQLLAAKSNLRIRDIAVKVGYAHAHNFMRAFKKHLGKTPGQYRREAHRALRLNRGRSFRHKNIRFG